MRKLLYIISVFVIVLALYIDSTFNFSDQQSIYNSLNLNSKLEYSIFKKALDGKRKYCKYTRYISVIDFTKPSIDKRFYLFDLKGRKLLFNTYVAHGKNSGENYATQFSNIEESHMSSLGFYKTEKTYYGKHGYSLRLSGLEKGINDNAEKRAIVIHGADYVSEDFIQKHGRLGRSHGCPALPRELSKEIINMIKDGTCLYIYSK